MIIPWPLIKSIYLSSIRDRGPRRRSTKDHKSVKLAAESPAAREEGSRASVTTGALWVKRKKAASRVARRLKH